MNRGAFRFSLALCFDAAVKLAILVTVGQRVVPLEQVSDRRIVTAFEAAAREIGDKLERVRCPKHKQTVSNVRVKFDASGAASLEYESCCEALGAAVSRKLG